MSDDKPRGAWCLMSRVWRRWQLLVTCRYQVSRRIIWSEISAVITRSHLYDPMEATDTGVVLIPTGAFADCPKDLDAIFVGGGPGQIAVMRDPEVLAFLAERGQRAKYVTSVCSGSLVLGAAGLLQGYKASCHWALHPAIGLFGATPEQGRVVTDRNRVTGGGVTAGIDFGLVLLAKLLGEDIAKMTRLALEYDPAPPFDAGTPQKAAERITKMVQNWVGALGEQFAKACEVAAQDINKYTPKP